MRSNRTVFVVAFATTISCSTVESDFIDPQPPPPPPHSARITSFTVTPNIIMATDTIIHTWQAANASSCLPRWKSGILPAEGEDTVPASSITGPHRLVCLGNFGNDSSEISVTVLGPFSIRIFRGDNIVASCSGMRVVIYKGVIADSAPIPASCSLSITTNLIRGDSLCLRIEPGNAQVYGSSTCQIGKVDFAKERRIVLIPKLFVIGGTLFGGQTLQIDLATDAFALSSDGVQSIFGRDFRGPQYTPGNYWENYMETWSSGTMPVPVAFDSANSPGPLDENSWTIFSANIMKLNENMGMNLVRPAKFSELSFTGNSGFETWHGIRVINLNKSSGVEQSGSGVSRKNDGSLDRGELLFYNLTHLLDPTITQHEILHTLGLFHSAFNSIMTPVVSCFANLDPNCGFTPKLVGYFQFFYTMGELVRSTGAQQAIPEAYQWQRGGLPEPSRWYGNR